MEKTIAIILFLTLNIGLIMSTELGEGKPLSKKELKYDLQKRIWNLVENLNHLKNRGQDDEDIVEIDEKSSAPPIPKGAMEKSDEDNKLEGIPPQAQNTGDNKEQVRKIVSRRSSSERLFKERNVDEDESEVILENLSSRGLQNKKRRKNRKNQRASTDWPYSYGYNVEILASQHPSGKMRAGQATDSHTCNNVRAVPSELRSASNMYIGIGTYYQKYTEVYGIPIIGSANVSDGGLSRACHTIKMMLASRYDIRNVVYKYFGRIALIGDGEQQTSLAEYTDLSPADEWNTRVRGLGPTLHKPITSAGDDNQRCKAGDRYWDQDILVHEFSHHIEQYGANHVVPGFRKRLYEIYNDVVKIQGKWGSSYASTNSAEYFATASQFYFNAYKSPGGYTNFGVTDRDTLRAYDPKITALLDEVHPCIANEGMSLLHRCNWKACDATAFQLVYDKTVKAKSTCPELKSTYNIASLDACAAMTCHYKGNLFNFEGTKCQVRKCNKTKTNTDMELKQGLGSYNIYKMIPEKEPQLDLSEETSQTYTSLCLNGPQGTSQCNVPSADRQTCGWSGINKSKCKKVGCCWGNSACFYPKQVCLDTHYLCGDRAKMGYCSTNPGFMYRECPLSCGICHRLDELNQDDLANMCQDKNIFCADWLKSGQCDSNPSWMGSNCAISCSKCTAPADPLA